MNSILFHYDNLENWNREYYKDVFLPMHLTGDEIAMGSEEDKTFFFVAKRDKQLYLIPSHIIENGDMPFRATETIKMGYKSKAYIKINRYESVVIRPQMTMTYKEMIDSWCDYEHDNKKLFTLWKIIVDTWYNSRINVRVVSHPGWMKDSIPFTLSRIRGNCFTINKPTLAKLKFLLNSSIKGLALNEIQKLDDKERNDLAKFYEDVGDFKTIYMNPSRAANAVSEQCNISNLSTFTFSNFPDSKLDYDSAKKEIFDNIFDPKIRSRIFPLLFTGGDERTPACKQRFPHITEAITPEQVNEITIWLRNHLFYEEHGKELAIAKSFTNNYFSLNTRWHRNIEAIAERVMLYSDTQEEFNEWMDLLLDCNKKYMDWIDTGSIPNQPTEKQSTIKEEQIY